MASYILGLFAIVLLAIFGLVAFQVRLHRHRRTAAALRDARASLSADDETRATCAALRLVCETDAWLGDRIVPTHIVHRSLSLAPTEFDDDNRGVFVTIRLSSN